MSITLLSSRVSSGAVTGLLCWRKSAVEDLRTLRFQQRHNYANSNCQCYFFDAVLWNAVGLSSDWRSGRSKSCAHGIRLVRKFKVDASMKESRCAIITGVARPNGIGRQLVYSFLKQGYNVVGADVQEPNKDEKLDDGAFKFVRADISNPVDAKRVVDASVEAYGGQIHVLINNAAKLPHTGAEDPLKEFSDTVAVNLIGAYNMSHYAIPFMSPGKSTIVYMSSTRAHQSEPDTPGYSASKAGLCGLTHSQAITLAGKVRVNAVLPGWINTDEQGEAALRDKDHAWHPAGRVGVPQDVAEMCLFLCDERRSGFITGQEFVVDGGVSKKMVYPE